MGSDYLGIIQYHDWNDNISLQDEDLIMLKKTTTSYRMLLIYTNSLSISGQQFEPSPLAKTTNEGEDY